MIRNRQATGGKARRDAAVGEVRPRTLSARPVMALVVLFTLFYGGIIGVKLSTEYASAVESADASRALSADFLAMRVNDRLGEVGGALGMASAQIETREGAAMTVAAETAVAALVTLPQVSSAAFLFPDGRVSLAGPAGVDELRAAADAALISETGVAALPGSVTPLAAARPAPLADGSVGALVVAIRPDTLLGDAPAGEVALLTDSGGRLLAIRPEAPFVGAPLAAERFGLDPARVAAMAEVGGSMAGAVLAGTPKTLGAAAVAGAPVHALSLGPTGMSAEAWRHTLLFHLFMFLAPFGAAVALSAVLRDKMSLLDDAQLRLRDSESRLRLAIEGARCGVWDWDLETDDVVLTDSFARLIGRTGAEALSGPELLLLVREEDRSRVRAALRGAAQAKDVDVEVRSAQLPVWIQLRGRLKNGTRRIVGVAIDITERKGAQARVAAAESRLRAALESMSESFVLWDARKRLVLWNRKFREFFGFEDAVLRPGMSYRDVEAAAGRVIKALHGADESAEAYDLELADGRWLRYSERRTADGGLVSVGADITELKAQEAALKDNDRKMRRTVENLRLSQERIQELAASYEQEKIRAEEANRSKSEFLANMSHELRTPLNAINGFSEIMAGEMFGPLGHDRYKGYVGDILSSGQHLLSLINDILDMSKIEAGKMQLQPEPIEPVELIEQCVRIMRARAEEKSIQLKVEARDLPVIEADPRALKQVLLNLMSNAVKFTPDGGVVTVRGFDAADGIVLQVADTGIGIAAEDLPRVGRPFEQIESQHSKKHAGSGLGLALSKSLVELHGGALRIDSVVGKGTTVSFSLPRLARRPVEDEAKPEPAFVR